MKKLKLNKKDKEKLMAKFLQQLNEIEEEDEVVVNISLKEPTKNKITVLFTPEAYLRCQALVKSFSGEVGWNGLIRKINETTYRVYDIMVYPQVVNGMRTIDPTETNDWYDKYDNVYDDMMFQAHSHVNMSTAASTTDMQNQMNMVKNMQGTGFRLFQIWNKQGEINSFLYDLDKNLVYDKDDIDVKIETAEFGTIDSFIEDAKNLASDIHITPQNKESNKIENGYQYTWIDNKHNEGKPTYDPFYWSDGMGHEGWN